MPYPQQTPYDILEVTPSISRDQLTKAYVQAQKSRKYPPNKLAKAYNDLRNGRKRLEADLFVLSNSGDLEELKKFVEGLPPCEYISPTLEPFALPYERILLLDFDPAGHEVDIPANPYSLRYFNNEPDPQKYLFNLTFPW